jgi:hypothetical protein
MQEGGSLTQTRVRRVRRNSSGKAQRQETPGMTGSG